MNALHHKLKSQSGKRAVNVSLDKNAVAGAKEMGINISQACEAGLMRELKAAREEKWIKENWDAIQSFNDYVAKNGLPLAKYRQF
jgi:antitoxin CcdA